MPMEGAWVRTGRFFWNVSGNPFRLFMGADQLDQVAEPLYSRQSAIVQPFEAVARHRSFDKLSQYRGYIVRDRHNA